MDENTTDSAQPDENVDAYYGDDSFGEGEIDMSFLNDKPSSPSKE